MLQYRRTLILVCVVVVLLALLTPALLAVVPPAKPVYASELCQMEYKDRTVMGKPAWEVTAITMGPDGGRLDKMQFQPGDVIVRIGSRSVEPGDQLDALIRTAILEQQRTVTLSDPLTGHEIIHAF